MTNQWLYQYHVCCFLYCVAIVCLCCISLFAVVSGAAAAAWFVVTFVAVVCLFVPLSSLASMYWFPLFLFAMLFVHGCPFLSFAWCCFAVGALSHWHPCATCQASVAHPQGVLNINLDRRSFGFSTGPVEYLWHVYWGKINSGSPGFAVERSKNLIAFSQFSLVPLRSDGPWFWFHPKLFQEVWSWVSLWNVLAFLVLARRRFLTFQVTLTIKGSKKVATRCNWPGMF